MSKEIPEFLIEMAKQINTQNNRLTADPLFEVRHKSYLVTEEGYNESHYEIVDEEGNTLFHELKDHDCFCVADYLIDYHEDWCKEWMEENEISGDMNSFRNDFNTYFELTLDWDSLPGELRKVHFQEIEVTVNSHFTEADAQAFINRKQHDYPKLYIYAISMCYCENMIKLRNWIKALDNK